MTRFIDVPALTSIIKRIGVPHFIQGITDTVREDFQRWNEFEKSPRLASHSKVGVIELMPVSNSVHYGFKYVNGHPGNFKQGLSTVMAFGALADVDTGYPRLISELTLMTAFRTAATSVLAADALARPDSKILALIGCGAQSAFQAIAFHTLLGIRELRIYDIDRASMDKLRAHLKPYRGLKITPASSAAEAVRGADIITTCTADKTWATILTPDMVDPGMHINGLGGDCPGKTELHPDILRNARVCVEYEPQTRIEGDIQQLPADHPVIELWQILSGSEQGRTADDQVTVFDSVGFALEDFSALRYLEKLANELEAGGELEIVPKLSDPKDLFQCLVEVTDESISKQTAA